MRVWAVSFFVFFGVAELIHWLQGLTLPFAIYVIAGALLAIASNSEKWTPILSSTPASETNSFAADEKATENQ